MLLDPVKIETIHSEKLEVPYFKYVKFGFMKINQQTRLLKEKNTNSRFYWHTLGFITKQTVCIEFSSIGIVQTKIQILNWL